ncbi:MAG: class I SAM-dependent methyltransferase [Chloroflexi bacterium]|nr:class I SAM-dependent methyltransferase [Chloroflexota bacterium]
MTNMVGLAVKEKAIVLGHPSYVWRFGQERRLNLVRQYVSLEGKRILDIGCGTGTYVRQFRSFSDEVYGVDIDAERVKEGGQTLPNLAIAQSESLPFADNSFDVTFLHEVIEHVADEHRTVREAYRVTKGKGSLIIFAPNRLYPFETHGFFWGRRYFFKLLPFGNYLPVPLRRLLIPHVRAYLRRDLLRLFQGLMISIKAQRIIFPGFDGIATRKPKLAALLRRLFYSWEGTPLQMFGLSHFWVVVKDNPWVR